MPKISQALYKEGNKSTPIDFNQLDRLTYEQNYYGKLYCINNCDVQISFTQRDDGSKFFSTWNNQGPLHNTNCPYKFDNEGTKGIKKTNGDSIEVSVTEDDISSTIKNRFKYLKNRNKRKSSKSKPTPKQVPDGEKPKIVIVDGGAGGDGSDSLGGAKPRFHGINASLLSLNNLGDFPRVEGIITDVQFDESNGVGYINFTNNSQRTSAYLTQAFYAPDSGTTINDLREYIKILDKYLSLNKLLFTVCVGFISEKKDKTGINVEVLHPYRIYVNEKSYFEIRYSGTIPDLPFSL